LAFSAGNSCILDKLAMWKREDESKKFEKERTYLKSEEAKNGHVPDAHMLCYLLKGDFSCFCGYSPGLVGINDILDLFCC